MHGGRLRPALDHQRIEVRKTKRKCRASAAMAFRVLVVIGGLEGTDRLAHKREIAGKRPDREDERLVRVVPWAVRMAVPFEQQGCEPAPAGNGISAVHDFHGAPACGQVDVKHFEMISDHAAPPAPVDLTPGASAISRQSWGQKGTHRPQWMQTNGSVSRVEINGIHRTGSAHLPQRMQRFFFTITPPPFAASKRPWGKPGHRGPGCRRGTFSPQIRWTVPPRGYADPRLIPREILVHQPGAGKRTGMAADAALHPWCGQDLHRVISFTSAADHFAAGEASQAFHAHSSRSHLFVYASIVNRQSAPSCLLRHCLRGLFYRLLIAQVVSPDRPHIVLELVYDRHRRGNIQVRNVLVGDPFGILDQAAQGISVGNERTLFPRPSRPARYSPVHTAGSGRWCP